MKAIRWRRVGRALSLVYGLMLFRREARARLRSLARRAASHLGRKARERGFSVPNVPDNVELYRRWRCANEPDESQLAAQRRIAAGWRGSPLISIVSPVFLPPGDAFSDCIASVRAQTYDRWELVLVLAGPQPDEVLRVVREASADSRVRAIALSENRGIASSTNAGLANAIGEFVAFLDHDDLLSPDALFEVVREARMDPDLDVVTFDEDKVTADGKTRVDPLFKPWAASPEHMLSINDRMHSVIRKSWLDELGGLSSGVDGAQDWDLGLRLVEQKVRSRHISRVLYHWRMVPGSAAGDALAKPWAYEAQRTALRRHLERQGLRNVVVEHVRLGVPRAHWEPSGRRVSIIVPTKDRAELLEACLRSIRERTAYTSYEILVIDTGSREKRTERLFERLANDGAIRVLRESAPFNYSRVNNLGAREAKGEILVFLNNDIEVVSPDWLDELVRWAERPEIGCVGPKLVYPDGSLQHAGIVMGLGGHGSHIYQGGSAHHEWGVFGSVDFYRNTLALTGACLAIRRSLFEALGGFDEAYTLCYSDIDLCLKAAEKGHRNVYTPFASLVHKEGGTRGLHFPPGDVLRASVRMYPLVIHGDPFFSRNLSFQERLPTISIEDDPCARASMLDHIAGLFGVREELRRALHDELVAKTGEWRTYESLVRSTHPTMRPLDRTDGRSRFLFVTHDLSRSGAPMVVLHLARALIRLGHAARVLAPKGGRLREDFEEAGIPVMVDPLSLEAPYALGEMFGSFDAVLPNTVLNWRVVLAAKALGKPVIWLVHESQHGLDFVRGEPGAVQALGAADEVVFPSRSTLSLYEKLGAGNLSAELYGIDAPATLPPLPPLESDSFHFAALGSLEPRKGQDVLVSAIRRLSPEIRDKTTVHLIGRPLDLPFVEALRGDSASLRVRVHGEIPPAKALAFLASSDALVCSSRDETGPLAVMEAMALGKPIVSTAVGAVPELLEDGRSGLLVRPGKVRDLTEALARLLKDPERGRRLGEAARLTFDERLESERYARAIESRVARAIERGRTPERAAAPLRSG
ncbi:MAG TPA: glycosyltransferase [Vicinamibacteria bacterium]|nr:glycosyltransferase [Vicinamibacteria bacterium]